MEAKSENQTKAEQFKLDGNRAYQELKFSLAAELYTKAHEAAPGNATYLSNRAAAFMEMGDYEDCINDCLKAESFCSIYQKIWLIFLQRRKNSELKS